MKYSAVLLSALAAGTLAIPTGTQAENPTATSTIKPIFGPGHHVIDSKCPKLPLPTNGPLPPGFPIAHQLGSQISPALRRLVGKAVIEDIDKAADQLCVSSMRSGEGNGVCQDTFAAARDFIDAKTSLDKSKQFGCLLNLLCVAHTGPTQPGTCNQLFGIADCTANTLLGVKPTECTLHN